jgi:hypothetical protein
MDFIKGQAVVGFPFEMVTPAGVPVSTGVVSGYITKDGGDQETLSMVPVSEGNGQWTVNFSSAEMYADILGLLFLHPSAVPQHFIIKTIVEPVEKTYVPATTESVVTEDDLTWYFYGTISRANVYFSRRLNTRSWDTAVYSDREAALIQATRTIDKLNFAGDKADSSQSLQFPRNNDAEVPIEIEFACYEIVLVLLDGYNQDQEIQTIGVLSESYSSVRTTYDGDFVAEHVRAGIPSIEAWEYLYPFLRDSRSVRISRVS